MAHETDGKYLVVEGGQRVSGKLHENQKDAQAEADKIQQKRPVVEAGGQAEPPKVVRNLCG